MTDLLVKRDDLRECRIVEGPAPEIDPGQALLRVDTFGLTSPRSAELVEGLGIYDRAVAYDAIDSLDRGPAAFVDVAGDVEVRRAVHSHHGDDLVHSMAVGVTHWEDFGAGGRQAGLSRSGARASTPSAMPTAM